MHQNRIPAVVGEMEIEMSIAAIQANRIAISPMKFQADGRSETPDRYRTESISNDRLSLLSIANL